MPRARIQPCAQNLATASGRAQEPQERRREGESLINQVFTGYKAISACHWFKISETISRCFVYPVHLGLSETHLAHPRAMGMIPRESPGLGRQR